MTIKSGWKHKPNVSQFIPRNSKKYCGSYPIIIRSSWERMFCQWLDMTPSIIEWSSENIHINYYDPVQGRTRRYYPDFYMLVLEPDGKYGKYIVEIKPAKETKPPRKTGKKSKKTLRHQQATYITNQAKFEAAEGYCKKIGMEFKIITEKELFNK
jgi:hypothetical protein